MMQMKDPAHPGEILKGLYLDPLGITITNAANMLGVSRKTLSELVNQKAGISSVMALRLAKAFPNTTPAFWLQVQNTYDLAQKKDHPTLSMVQVIHTPDLPEARYTKKRFIRKKDSYWFGVLKRKSPKPYD